MIIRELIDSEENYLKRMKYIIDVSKTFFFTFLFAKQEILFIFSVY